jgi:arsenite-transporting ATPase
LDKILEKRIVLVTGKGGVGRSSVTAAIAAAAARRKKRVLVTELGVGDTGAQDSHLARIFGLERLPESPQEVAPGIRASLLLSHVGQEKFLRSVLPIGALAKAALGSEALKRLLNAAPSFREMGIFYHLLELIRACRSDGGSDNELILIDMPATGHTLALTGLPEVLLKLVPRGPMAEALREGQAWLNNPKTGAAYVVTLPETLPVSETLELLAGLARTSMPAGGVILNKMPQDPFTAAEREALRPILESKPLLGTSGYRRVEESRRSLDRLLAECDLDVYSVAEEPSSAQPGLMNAMATGLEGHPPIRRAKSKVAVSEGVA